MGAVLGAVLQIGAVSDLPGPRSDFGQVGHAEIQEAEGPSTPATHWLGRIARRQPRLFVHWQMGVRPAAGR